MNPESTEDTQYCFHYEVVDPVNIYGIDSFVQSRLAQPWKLTSH